MTISKKTSVTFTDKDIKLIEDMKDLCDDIFYGLGDGCSLNDLDVILEHDTDCVYDRYSQEEILKELYGLESKLSSILNGI